MSKLDNVRTKIAALMSKTKANGATEAEANAAMAIASKLMAEYGVTLESLKQNPSSKQDFTLRRFNDGVNLSVLDKFVATAIAKYTDTKAWNELKPMYSDYKRKTEANVMFYGYSVDVELAEYIYNVCKYAMETEWKKYSIKLPKGYRKAARTSFMLGMAVRLRDRLIELKAENVAHSGGSALVVVKTDLIEKSIREDLKVGDLKGSNSSTRYRSGRAFNDGKEAGNRVKFNRSVHNGPTGGAKMIK